MPPSKFVKELSEATQETEENEQNLEQVLDQETEHIPEQEPEQVQDKEVQDQAEEPNQDQEINEVVIDDPESVVEAPESVVESAESVDTDQEEQPETEAAEVVPVESAETDEVQGKIDPKPEPEEIDKQTQEPRNIEEYLLANPIVPYSILRKLRFVDADQRLFYLDDLTAGDVFILRPL